MKNIGNKVEDFFVHILIMVSGVLALGGIIGGPLILIYQCFIWLQKGSWESIRAIDVFKDYISIESLNWMQSPKTWVGISKIISYIVHEAPLSGVLTIGGVALLMAMVWIVESKQSS